MNQTYDPMRYVDRTGAGVSQIGREVAGTLGQFFQQNAEWKQFKAEQGSEEAAKKKYYDTAMEVFRERGIDTASVNVPLPDDKRFATSEDYAENLSKSVEHLFFGSGNRPTAEDATKMGIQQQPGVKEGLAKQSFLDQYDKMGQIDLAGKTGVPAPTGAAFEDANQKIDPMLADITGAQQVPEAPGGQGGEFDQLYQELVKQVRGGGVTADKAFDRAARIKELEIKERLEDKKADREEKKRMNELHAAGVYSAGDTNEIIDPNTGEPTTVTKENVLDLGVGDRKYPPKSGRSGGSGGGGSADALKEQKEAWDQYNDVERQRLAMVKGKDELGNAVPFNAESFAQKTNESVIRLLAYDLTASGVDLGASNATAIKTIDAPMAIVSEKASEPVIKIGETWALNMANKKIRTALIEAARNGVTASELLTTFRRAKGLNPARQW